MPRVHPFNALHYDTPRDQSALIAPPYDVLDAAGKQRLLAKDLRNIVAIDLPHTPAKELGPPGAYAAAAEQLRQLHTDGTLTQTSKPVMFAYRQTWMQRDGASSLQTRSRSGMACTLETVPFGPRPGGGILPHEETFSGPKEDRLALMQVTRTQLSPIFGLHADEHGRASDLLRGVMSSRQPDRTATTDDGTLHEVWTIDDTTTIATYETALAGEDVFVADGHHRYTTALNYLRELEAAAPLAADHPAHRTMFVLVGMSDPGLTIWPTHRVLGGMKHYSIDALLAAAAHSLAITEVNRDPHLLTGLMEKTADFSDASNVFGLIDFATGRCFVALLKQNDPLANRFSDKPLAWRTLDVALVQHLIVEEICQPKLNDALPIKWAFPHTIEEVQRIGRGHETGAGGGSDFAQLAVILRPTPLSAVRDIRRANVLMPQKSTFFYPKLATGLFMHMLG